jgi:hypothetical protein
MAGLTAAERRALAKRAIAATLEEELGAVGVLACLSENLRSPK